MVIYDDALENGWNNWSWSATVDPNSTAYVHGGSKAMAVTITAAWGALSLEHNDINSSSYSNLTFWINGGPTGGQQLQLYAEAPLGTSHAAVSLGTLAPNAWQKISLSLASLGVANQPNFARFSIQETANKAQPVFYLDDMLLATNANPSPVVSLASPSDGSTFVAPASLSLAATVVSNAHSIVKVQFYSNATNLLGEDAAPPYVYAWTNVAAGNYSLIARGVFDTNATVDSASANVTVTGVSAVSITVDALANRHAISPQIYGTAFASSNQIADLNFTMNRSGGNAETRYNWQLNAHNHGADWYFESLDDGSSTPGASADDFVANSKNGGAQPMITIPMIGWMTRLGPGRARLCSYSTNLYGPQTGTDWQWFPDAGNGVASPSGSLITTNNPNDANFLTNSLFQQGYVQHLIGRWGNSTNGGVHYYLLDNEHSLWFSTHRDVHPVGPTMQEMRDRMFDYGGMVKSNDPNALLLGPEEWGWSGYFSSGYDQQNSGSTDRNNNGGWDYGPWLLNQMHQYETSNGRRLLDYFTLHCYPQGKYNSSITEYGDDVSTAAQTLRNQSTRQMWDSNYVDQSWIGVQPANNILMLIPRMRNWVNTYYPGTKIGITEYNWGAEGAINGATAQADLLGIFGREGLDLATRWTTPDPSTPTYKAMKIYRNYDGNGSTFGDMSVAAGGPNPDLVSVFAATRSSDGALTVMVVNKQLNSGAALTINLAHFGSAGTAQAWQLTSANSINHLTDVSIAGSLLNSTVPAQSITLFVLPAGGVAPPPAPLLVPGGLSNTNTFYFALTNGIAGQRYLILSSTDLLNWSALLTNTLSTSWTNFNCPAPDAERFYRAQWAP